MSEEFALITAALRHVELYYRNAANTYGTQGLDQEVAVAHRQGDAFLALYNRLRPAPD